MAAVAGGNATAAILASAGSLLTARFIDPETAGAFRAFTIPLMYLTFLHLGTFDGLHRQIPLFVGQNRRDLVESVAAAGAGWNLLLSTAISGAFLVLSTWALIHGDPRAAAAWAAQAVLTWGAYYGGYLGATYRTLDSFVLLARTQVLQAVLSFLLVFTLPVLGFFGLCLRAAMPSATNSWLLHRIRPIRVRPSLLGKNLAGLIRIGLPFCFWGSLYTSLWFAAENTLVLMLGGTKGLGLFAVAVVLREGFSILPQAVQQVLGPRVVEAYGREGSLEKAAGLALAIVPAITLGMTVLAIGLVLALDALVPMLIPRYAEGLPLMKLALWTGVVECLSLPLSAIVALGRSWIYGRGVLPGLVAFPLVTYLLAPHIEGTLAVVAGSAAGRVVRVAVGYWELARLIRKERE